MIRRLLTLGLFLVFGLLVFNYFLGTPEDKENVKNVTESIKNLFESTKKKYEDGQYDDALKKVGDVFNRLRDVVKEKGGEFEGRLRDLEEKKTALEEQLEELKSSDNRKSLVPIDNSKREKEIRQELDELLKEIDALTNDLDE